VGDDFGVGLAFEDVPRFGQLGPQFVVILDDAVMHQGDARRAALAGEMGMCVVRGRCAVGRPAGMGDAGEPADVIGSDLFDEFGHALRASRALEAAVGVYGHAAGVIAAVFEPLQTFKKNGSDVTPGDCANDSAQRVSPKGNRELEKNVMIV
jgi:hypothetical protein